MSNLDDEITRGTFETGSFGARFKICFDRERRDFQVCFDVGASTEHELYVARYIAGQACTEDACRQQIATQESWAATLKNLRWLRSQSPYTLRNWLRDKGFEPFIDTQVTAARTEAAL
jgi:hypothetical protein